MEESAYQELRKKLLDFMREEVYPNEERFRTESHHIGISSNEWTHAPVLVELKEKAKARGLWNLWFAKELAKVADLGPGYEGGGLSNFQYGSLCEIMGTANHMEFAAEAMNCASPDTGNMETIARFGTVEQKERWLKPLLDGRIRSCFAMTEPGVASSDATNISASIVRDEAAGEYVINGRKWWITGAGSLHCKICIFMGRTAAPGTETGRHGTATIVLVPMDTPGITLVRPMQVLGDDEAPKGHFEMLFENVRVPFANILAGEGRGFEIAQARLGPGRIHHCMRLLGTAERSLSAMCRRVENRTAFGKKLAEFDTILADIARSRADIDQARMLVQRAAARIDREGSKAARQELSMVKFVVPMMVQTVADRAMQAHGAMGLSQDTMLATALAWARWLRYADGPDEVHLRTVGRLELKEQHSSHLYALAPYEPPAKIFRRSTDPISAEVRARL